MGATGTATLDFGAFPGSSHATVAVTGQAAIVAGSLVEAWVRPVATADHTADEHMVETLKVVAADIVAGTGFTVHGFNTNEIYEPVSAIEPIGVQRDCGRQDSQTARARGGTGTLIYGAWTVAWAWN